MVSRIDDRGNPSVRLIQGHRLPKKQGGIAFLTDRGSSRRRERIGMVIVVPLGPTTVAQRWRPDQDGAVRQRRRRGLSKINDEGHDGHVVGSVRWQKESRHITTLFSAGQYRKHRFRGRDGASRSRRVRTPPRWTVPLQGHRGCGSSLRSVAT